MAFTGDDGVALQGEMVVVQRDLVIVQRDMEKQKEVNRALTEKTEAQNIQLNIVNADITKVKETQEELMMMLLKIQEKGLGGKGKPPHEMVTRRSFQSVESYNGNREEHEHWRFAITGFFEEEKMFVDFSRRKNGTSG